MFMICLVLNVLCFWAVGAEKKFFTITAGPVTATWYPTSAKISEIVKPVLPDCVFRVSAGGGVYNVKAVDAGKDAQFGMANSDTTGAGYVGGFPFEKVYKNIRGISHMYASPMQIVTTEGSGITDPKQLGNKRLAVGNPGASEEVASRRLLKQYGWDYKSIEKAGGKISFITATDSGNALRDGHIDAFIAVVGPPASYILELVVTRKIRILDIPDDVRDSFVKNNPGFFKTEIPANMYKTQTKPVRTLGVATVFFCNKDVPEEVVYKVTKTMYEKADEIRKVKKSLRAFKLESALNGLETIPFHPGAEKYYREVGLIK
jgi:TRAP transporter TAXI family solute receptor